MEFLRVIFKHCDLVGKFDSLKINRSLSVAHAREFPVDLYYLMDLSNSMSDDKDTIVRMGQELVYAIQNITRDFQIGFGSFVDKEVMPFISLVPQDNCQLDTGCPQPYR